MSKIITLLLTIVFCNVALGQEASFKQSDLIGCWKFYPEENKFYPDITVYRPCKYNSFPARTMRFRFIMDLKNNGQCRYLKLAANDGHSMNDGKWTFDSESLELRILDLKGDVVKKLNLVRIEKKLLGANKN